MTFPSFCPINEAYATEKGTEYALGAENLLCCGPFYMSAWDVGGNTYQLKKNPTYYDADNVKLDEINFQIIKDPQQTMLAYENGTLDYVRLSEYYYMLAESILWETEHNAKWFATLDTLIERVAQS